VVDDVTSLCIDAGNPAIPLGDEPTSPDNVRINMGAYGGTAEASKTPTGFGILADLTNDGVIDFQDFAAQAGCFGQTKSEQPGDIDRDGYMTFSDVKLLSEQWLDACSVDSPNRGFD